MVKFDHMMLPVSDPAVSRDWYVKNLGFRMEFENPGSGTVAIQDDADFTIFLQKTTHPWAGEKCVLTIQVSDVDQTYRDLAKRGVQFLETPKRYFWGYGAELLDPDGYVVRLWDEASMRKKGSA
jgi:catechol 2,3-dioxygenase-like lactoylglutathione lyase family enzyme